jgi:nucleoside-diphosphate-sugar epimerase
VSRRILLTGATGLIGGHTAARLVRDGFVVRALVRDPGKLDAVLGPFGLDASSIEAARGDVADESGVAAAASGCDAAIHCAGRFSHDLSEADGLAEVNVEGTRNVLRAATTSGLDPVVHLSSMLALLPPRGPRMTADDPVGSARAMYSRTKALADRCARELQDAGAPVCIVYPGSVQGPHDPTLGSGPEIFAGYLRTGRVLVTSGGLVYTDVRDLARLLARLVLRSQSDPSGPAGPVPHRLMAPSDFVEHVRFHRLLCDLTGRDLAVDRVPAPLLRWLGRIGDLRQRLTGRPAQLTSEAALVLTRSVPFEDTVGRALLGAPPIGAERSFRDLLRWMFEAGVLEASHVGRIAEGAPLGKDAEDDPLGPEGGR